MAIDVPTGALIIACATLIGAALGAFIPEFWRNRVRRRNLRVALKAEMEQMHMLSELESHTLPEPAITEIIPTTVFEANAGNIGLLTQEEVTEITRFYSAVLWFQGELQIWEAAGDDKQELAENTLEEIKNLRTDAIDAIQKNL
jgi:hypothetical protein